MGSSLCKSVNISSNSRGDLKNSRFDPNLKKKKNASKRGQVQPISSKIAIVNTSYLNHTKSNVTKNSHNSSKDHFFEELECNYCKDSLLNGAIAGQIASDQLSSSDQPTTARPLQEVVSPSLVQHRDGKPLTPFVPPPSRSPSDPSLQVDIVTRSEQVPTIVHTASSSSCADKALDTMDPIDNCSEIIYRSVSTIPLASDKSSDSGEEAEISEVLLLSKAKSLDKGIDSTFKRNHQAHNVGDNQSLVYTGHEQAIPHKAPLTHSKSGRKCNFCDFVKNGSGRSWNDLDKDVSMLMETVDKLSSLIAEKELNDKENISQMFQLKDLKSKSLQSDSFDDSDEIIEEKKVSLSFLEKLHAIDLKEKVQQLRNKRRIGISLMKTSRGKRLMVFSDGQNTYQIQGELNKTHICRHVE